MSDLCSALLRQVSDDALHYLATPIFLIDFVCVELLHKLTEDIYNLIVQPVIQFLLVLPRYIDICHDMYSYIVI